MTAHTLYTELKPSGADWLGAFPLHWDAAPLRVFLSLRRDIVGIKSANTRLLSLTLQGVIERDLENKTGKMPESFDGYQRISPGEMVFCLFDMDETPRTVGISPQEGMVTGAYAVFRPVSGVWASFLHYFFLHVDEFKRLRPFYRGLRKTIRPGTFLSIPVPRPSEGEAAKIIAYLKRSTDRIDTLIAKKTRFIELLDEKLQALIAHAVTNGLHVGVPVKDSGVEWLGKIPASWATKRLRFVCDVTTGAKDTANASPDGQYPFYVRSQVVERIDTYSADCEAVLTAGDGAGVGKVYHYANGKFDFHQRVYMMHNFRDIRGKFFFYYLRSLFAAVALDGGAKSTVDSLRMPVFKNFHVTVPSLSEQDAIVAFIEERASRMDTLIAKTERSTELLREHRTALITAAVTGRIDLREAT